MSLVMLLHLAVSGRARSNTVAVVLRTVQLQNVYLWVMEIYGGQIWGITINIAIARQTNMRWFR